MFHKKAWNTPKTSHHIPPFLRSLSQFIQRSLAIETQPGTFQPKQTFFPQRSLSQSYQKRFAQNIPTTFLPYVPAWNIPAKTNFPPQRSLSQFTQRSLAIETHLLTARFPQRSLSQSYQKRFAQNIPTTFEHSSQNHKQRNPHQIPYRSARPSTHSRLATPTTR